MVRRTKEEALETRYAILDAAERVFQEKGVSHTSLADIATEAGVTRGAIYWHFKNKADLFDAMFQRFMDPLEAQLMKLQERRWDNPLDLLRAQVRLFLDRITEDPRFQRVFEIAWHKCEYVGEMAEIRDNHLECGNRYLNLNEGIFRAAREKGFLPASVDPRQAAVGIMAIIDGLVVNWTLDPTLFPLGRCGMAVVDSYLAGLSASSALYPAG
jgi:TetR/AcrR family acrAB operon transcriptional repressor